MSETESTPETSAAVSEVPPAPVLAATEPETVENKEIPAPEKAEETVTAKAEDATENTAAPIPLTAVAVEVETGTAEKRTKRKYTRRTDGGAPKKKEKKMARKAKVEKTPKVKRIAGVKAQGQISKGEMRYLKSLAKTEETTVGALVSTAVKRFAKSKGYEDA